jgi:hypothetical protein
MFIVLAHGALGYWDEVILFLIVAIFLGFTVVSWLKTRQEPTDIDPSSSNPSTANPTSSTNKNPSDKNHFELD